MLSANSGGLAESGGEGQWEITGEGREWLKGGRRERKGKGEKLLKPSLHKLTSSDPLWGVSRDTPGAILPTIATSASTWGMSISNNTC